MHYYLKNISNFKKLGLKYYRVSFFGGLLQRFFYWFSRIRRTVVL